jgi:hypothetical protein
VWLDAKEALAVVAHGDDTLLDASQPHDIIYDLAPTTFVELPHM